VVVGSGGLESVLDDKKVKNHSLKRAGEPVAVRGRPFRTRVARLR